MKTKDTPTNRRKFVNKLFKSAAVGLGASAIFSNKILANSKTNSHNLASLYAMWSHGNQGMLEGVFHNGKDAVGMLTKIRNKMVNFHAAGYARELTGKRIPGNTISLPGEAAATMIPTSGGALLTIWDSGSKANPKNGEFWLHYSIPTPVIANNVRAKATKILVKTASTDANFYVSKIELWDANTRIFNSSTKLWGPDKMHGFNLTNPTSVNYGLCLSLKINGERVSADKILEVSGVGVDLIA